MENLGQRKLLSAICHGAIFFSSTVLTIAIPIAILFLSPDPIVKANARESLNFHLTLYIYAFICFLLSFIIIGIPLLFLLAAASLIMPIIAIIKVLANPYEPFIYPLTFHLL